MHEFTAVLLCTNLPLQVRHHAETQTDKLALAWVDAPCEVADSRTYGQLWSESTAIAEKLHRKAGLRAGDRAMIVYPFGLDFLPAFLACLRMGMSVLDI